MELIQYWDTLIAQLAYIPVGAPARWGIGILSWNPLFKGVPILCLLIAAWVSKTDVLNARNRVMATVITGMIAVALGRFLALAMPFRLRPIYNGMLALEPGGTAEDGMLEWSAFPSDHAVVYFALAIGLFHISRRFGMLALLHAAFIICLPRLLIGLHFASDLIAGAALGTVLALLIWRPVFKAVRMTPLASWPDKWPQFAYPALFIIAFELSTMFDSLREVMFYIYICLRW